MNYILIPSHSGHAAIKPDIIVRVEASSNYCKIVFDSGKSMVVSKILQWVQDRLPQHMFARVHRSHLVNKNYVQVVSGVYKNTLKLSNGETIVMSRRRKGELARA